MSLSEDESLVLALRLRDGVPYRVRPHREDGVCRYARFYPEGGCDWCHALDLREAAALQPEKVVSLAERRLARENETPSVVRRIA